MDILEMVNIKKLAFLLVVLLIVIYPVGAFMAEDLVSRSSSALVNLGIMQGDHRGNLNLDHNITRCEFLTLVNRMMAYDSETSEDSTIGFVDVTESHWGYGNIRIAVNKGIIKGYTDNTFKPDNPVTFAEAQTILVRALGYEAVVTEPWPYGILEMSAKIKLNNYLNFDKNKIILRSEASVLIYNALGINIYGR